MNRDYPLYDVRIGARSRRRVWIMRWLLRPVVQLLAMLGRRSTMRSQLRLASGLRSQASGQAVDYDVLGGVPGVTINQPETHDGPVLLYLHGGGFMLPALPPAHVGLATWLCRELGAAGFMPDYRLAPLHRYPAALDDCEAAYRGLLEAGIDARRILLAGESAGGNLVLGLLQRIRRKELPMPVCAVPISPVTEVARVHAPPSRTDNAGRDPMLPVKAFSKMLIEYAEGCDGSDPELSPMLADFSGFPPLYFLVGETEVLLDDSLICARRARAAGVDVKLDVWPLLPHAFPLMVGLFSEAAASRADIAAFLHHHLDAAQ